MDKRQESEKVGLVALRIPLLIMAALVVLVMIGLAVI